ncbi:alpha/beta fold hydrolase [Microbacterium sp. NIBRBAC000506063]|uniref:alpha/beta fold hydrolase n=1 Tax=Microbacterium sp. NIBRBAC000506063 TaxID=2734618 RepID=UPI001BB6BCE8|nr:alpha/beta hydrolase [Microbacterium sp. NIBRBAC000506063]QTV79100.1 alpha/beta hydrolase [Microbacterium sp. NIBRBAC000506063]
MKLETREWGSGDRVAVLIHGVMSDSRNWRRVGPALAEDGYRVIAVDLRGHGRTGHAESYTLAEIAADVAETVPSAPRLVMGHSLGGLVIPHILDALAPERAIYVDPPFHFRGLPLRLRVMFTLFRTGLFRVTPEKLAKMNPQWEAEDIEAEIDNFRIFDSRILRVVLKNPQWHLPPSAASIPSLMVLADNSLAVLPEMRAHLEGIGYEFRVVKGAGHTVNRDDFDGFMDALSGWI